MKLLFLPSPSAMPMSVIPEHYDCDCHGPDHPGLWNHKSLSNALDWRGRLMRQHFLGRADKMLAMNAWMRNGEL